MKQHAIDPNLHKEVEKLGARDMEICMQCGICTASCPLSSGSNTFPRRIYRYLQLGLKDKLLESPEPWLCYYCGDCNLDCPRGAEPAETMMATRRWLTTQFDWTGLAKRFYSSPKWQIGGFLTVVVGIILLFLFGHGPVITDRVALNSFAPAHLVHIGDLIMFGILGFILISNGFRMYLGIMKNTRFSIQSHIIQAPVFVLHYLTQKRWRKCSSGNTTSNTRWLRHFLLFSGYVTMEVLVVGFIEIFQTDIVHPFWHPTRILGYYATVVIMLMSGNMLYSRIFVKEEKLHRYSDFSDLFFLALLFVAAFTGILVHFSRLLGFALTTYTIYVIHVAICVGMLSIMLPFGKLSHLFYRPLAIYLASIKLHISKKSKIDSDILKARVDETFMACMQCGTCTTLCPANQISSYSPRQVLRSISTDSATVEEVDNKIWDCVTCNTCVEYCPRGIEIVDLTKAVRELNLEANQLPKYLRKPLASLKQRGNPWNGLPDLRLDWIEFNPVSLFTPEKHQYCLFTCCTTAYDNSPAKGSRNAGQALIQLLNKAAVSYGTLGNRENCCGDLADRTGEKDTYHQLEQKNTELFLRAGVKHLLTNSPHCLNTFRNNYPELTGTVQTEHVVTLLGNLIKQNKLAPLGALNRKVTYHDPCYLGRYNGIYDEPRQILKSIPGIELVEMDSNKEQSLCCGGGGSGAFKTPSHRVSFGEIRVREALKTGADVIATACPYCIRMLNEAIRKSRVQKKVVVQDVAELLLQSVNLGTEDILEEHKETVLTFHDSWKSRRDDIE